MELKKNKNNSSDEIHVIDSGNFSKNGLKTDVWRTIDSDGFICFERRYLGGKLHGFYKSYYYRGEVHRLGVMKRGRAIGLWYEDRYDY
jgi:antitoxin component YwqK of YwqJK toxin-antitoxin module